MIHFTIVRHGETKCNVANIVQSRTHGELTTRGICMAQLLGQRLTNETFTHIYSSDLRRCRQTTKVILSNLGTPIPEVEYTALLQERDYGDWEMDNCQVVGDKRVAMGLPLYKLHHVDIPNGETFENCKLRAGKFFAKILKLLEASNEDINILTVSHGHLIACLIEYLMDNPANFQLVNFHQDHMQRRGVNTNLTRFSIMKIKDIQFKLDFSHFFDAEHLKNLIDN